ncbi:MAG: hypothetical protein SXV54_11445 [Chloroflexota bacterium]|nr:hypothetical protein [Chloroflexota bacterium]
MDILYTYVTVLCSLRVLFLGLLERLPAMRLALDFLGGGYVVPTGLALAAITRWFEGTTAANRAANQRAVLRGLVAASLAWGLAALIGWAWEQGLNDPGWGYVLSQWVCWQRSPFPSQAAALGMALGTALWRREWRWGLGCFLATGFWATAQVCLGLHYPLDVVVGAMLGSGLAWLLSSFAWLDRLLETFIRLTRRWMLA